MTGRAWSLRNRLIVLLAALAFGAWAASSAWLYHSARQQAGDLFDAALVETAHAVFAAVGHEGLRKDDDDFEFEPAEHVHAERIVYQLRDRRGRIRYASPGAPTEALAAGDASGFTETVADGAAYRVYTLLEPRRRAAIHVGQRAADREALVRTMALRLLLPGIAVVCLLSIGVWIIVRRVTAPVISFSDAIDARAPTDSGDVKVDGLPTELQPVAQAVNRLLERIEAALLRERTLTADAAHELRTPLAALRAQAQVALRSRDDAERREALQRTDRRRRPRDPPGGNRADAGAPRRGHARSDRIADPRTATARRRSRGEPRPGRPGTPHRRGGAGTAGCR